MIWFEVNKVINIIFCCVNFITQVRYKGLNNKDMCATNFKKGYRKLLQFACAIKLQQR